jgi:Tat protein translocase TatB subunit
LFLFFIFESFGTSELLLVGLVALILLGPRKLPEMARKAGKMMAEFRGTANEFKETWQREVNFEDEAKAIDLNTIEAETVGRVSDTSETSTAALAEPQIRAIDPAQFEHLKNVEQPAALPATANEANDKKNWL